MKDIQFVVLTFDDDTIGIMQIMLRPRLPLNTVLLGYDAETGTREATDEVINYEIDRSSFDKPIVRWRRAEFHQLPQDRTFREAWRDSGQHVYHDMPTCREMHRERIRQRRKPMLEELDVAAMRVAEVWPTGSAQQNAITARKQKLRNATKDARIEAAASPEELKTIDPLSD